MNTFSTYPCNLIKYFIYISHIILKYLHIFYTFLMYILYYTIYFNIDKLLALNVLNDIVINKGRYILPSFWSQSLCL